MNLKKQLMEKKPAILKVWQDAALTVPAGGETDFLDKQKTLLKDALGYDLAQGMDGLFNALLQGVIPDDVSRFLNGMLRIRAVSDFKASEAVAFIMEVKKIVRKELGSGVLSDPLLQGELTAWESAVDDLALYAFDAYAKNRESIFEFKASEAKKETFLLLKKAKLVTDDQD
jgi:RsbT co-antagonist protein rsbRD N-terminal domain